MRNILIEDGILTNEETDFPIICPMSRATPSDSPAPFTCDNNCAWHWTVDSDTLDDNCCLWSQTEHFCRDTLIGKTKGERKSKTPIN